MPSAIQPLPAPCAGWTAWVNDPAMLARVPKGRPWTRSHRARSGALWFPRSTSSTNGAKRGAIYSPPMQLPGLSAEGWFLVFFYIRTASEFVPNVTTYCGVLDPDYVAQLESAFEFWRADHFRRRSSSS